MGSWPWHAPSTPSASTDAVRAATVARILVGTPTITRTVAVLGGGVAALCVAVVVAIGAGSVEVAPGDIVAVLAHRLLGIGSAAGVSDAVESIVIDLRMPRVLGAALVGAGLGC